MAVYKGLRRFDRYRALRPGTGHAGHQSGMSDSIPPLREIVRHATGTLSGITPECCPPSVRNPVRHGPDYAESFGVAVDTRLPAGLDKPPARAAACDYAFNFPAPDFLFTLLRDGQ
jgi:hypothetical protein